jgi:hypothetical protein
LFRLRQGRFFDQHALPFVPFARAAEADHHGLKVRILSGPQSERVIASLEKHQVIEIGTPKAEGPLPIHTQELPFKELFLALRTFRVADNPEDYDLFAV